MNSKRLLHGSLRCWSSAVLHQICTQRLHTQAALGACQPSAGGPSSALSSVGFRTSTIRFPMMFFSVSWQRQTASTSMTVLWQQAAFSHKTAAKGFHQVSSCILVPGTPPSSLGAGLWPGERANESDDDRKLFDSAAEATAASESGGHIILSGLKHDR